MLTRLSALALPTLVTWGVVLSISLMSVGPAMAGKIIGNG
jgi:hypothetical protein